MKWETWMFFKESSFSSDYSKKENKSQKSLICCVYLNTPADVTIQSYLSSLKRVRAHTHTHMHATQKANRRVNLLQQEHLCFFFVFFLSSFKSCSDWSSQTGSTTSPASARHSRLEEHRWTDKLKRPGRGV